MRHPRLAGSMIGCAALLAAGMVPAQAAPPTETVTIDDWWGIWADGTNELASFVNVTRESYCTPEQVVAENAFAQWLVDGAVGEPPQDYPAVVVSVAFDMTAQQVTETNTRASGGGTVPVELWTFEEGKSWEAGNLVSPCLDTDGLLDLTDVAIAPGELFASGQGALSLRDNDWSGAGPRTNVWSERLIAEVSGPGGDYAYTFVGKNRARGGEYQRGDSRFALRGL